MDYLRELANNNLAYIAAHLDDFEFVKRYPELYENITLIEEEDACNKRQKILARSEAQCFKKVKELCGNELGERILECCLTALLMPEFLEIFKNGFEGKITAEAVEELTAGDHDYAFLRVATQAASKVLYCEKSYLPYFRYPFSMDERLLTYLQGDQLLDKRLLELGATIFSPTEELNKCYAGESALKEMIRSLKEPLNGQAFLQIAGGKGCGKQFLLQHACQMTGISMIFIDYSRIASRSEQELKHILWLIYREMILEEMGICFYHISGSSFAKKEDLSTFVREYLNPLLGLKQPVCTCTDTSVELIPETSWYMDKIAIADYSSSERLALWQGYSNQYEVSKQIDCVIAASKYKLSAKEIAGSILRMKMGIQRGEKIDEALVSRCCFAVLPAPDQGSIKRIDATYTLEDLKLADSQKQSLYDICAQVRQRFKVYATWQMEKKFPYGRNVSALFVGAPGTGKTMAVHVLSNMLDLPLYRVDLSQVVDKYIGETEKKLEEIFNLAEKSNTILFFDEADAIFGKRSEVQDAKDRYANTEVAYILQRIEQYDGIIILATNYKQNIDEAFMRRMRYLVDFHMPDQQLRNQIWQSSFSDKVPLGYIDFEFLARKFQLSGGSIKNIVLNAVFLAADDDDLVSMKHIVKSIKNENQKFGKSSLPEDFDEYYYE